MASVNEEIRINASFYFDDDISDATPASITEPDSVIFEVFNSADELLLTDDALVDGLVYYYLYTPTTEDAYTFRFTASFTGMDDVVVEDSIDIGGASATPEYLGSDVTITFSSTFTPMYIDISELTPYFPDVTDLEIAEAIYLASLKVQTLFDLDDDEYPPGYSLDYIQAAAGCTLSRIAGENFGAYSYSNAGFTLGDFSVKDSTGSNTSNGNANTGSAETWCELAFALEKEMKLKSADPKPFVHGGIYANPIPERRLNISNIRRPNNDSGRIDD